MKKALLLLTLLLPVLSASAQVDVLTQHNDNMRTGQNINEIILTPSNVNSSSFGKLFKTSVDGFVYAQPLYMSNVAIAGGTHNVVYVATENDSVYAFDADNGTQLWHASLVDANHGGTTDEKAVPVGDLAAAHCNNVKPLIGITSTPVIDRNTSSMYVEAKSELANGSFIHRLHMLDITTGAEISPGPSQITATVPGTGEGGTTITFNDATQFNRPGLLFLNGTVYIAYASHCDSTPYHGWIFAYNASSLARTAVFVANPNGTDAGIWMSGAGLAADSNGSIFSVTGNGTFDSKDFGDSIFKLILSGSTLALTDYFTPYNQSSLNSTDGDLGSGGVLLLPDQPGTFSHELIEAGKRSTIYLINRDQMTTNNTHYCSGCSSDSEIVQELTSAVGGGIWSMPAYWNNNVYFWGTNDYLKAFGLSNGRLTTSTSHSSMSLAFPGATPSVSSNGNTNGIVWAIDSSKYDTGPAVLHAFDATNVSHELWNSSQAANGRDTAGLAVKFTVPTIANGKVYIGAQGELDAYGLLGSGSGQVATPTFSPAPGTYTAALPVMISDATSGATIYYTADGTTPTTASPQYSAPITVSNTETIEAIAAASGMTNSAVATGIYTIQTSGGGSSPSYGSGFTSLGLTLNGGAAISGTRLRLTDGGTGEARSAFFTSPVNVQSFTNDFNFQLTNANADGFTFTIQGNSSTALGAPGGALGYGPNSTNTIPGIGRSAAVGFQLYSTVLGNKAVSLTGSWTNGASPSATPGVTTTGVDLHSGDLMNVHMTYDGTTLMWTITDSSTGKSFTQSVAINIPALAGNTAYVGFTGGTGGLTATQDILTWTYTSNLAAPSITTQPANQTVVIGQAATFSVVASGTAPLTYQWMENTGSGFNNISGANSSSYTTPPATSTDNGTAFEVLVTNAEGSVTSNSATLTVTSPLPPTITTQPPNQTVIIGQTATFSVVASGTAPLTYQWMENPGSGFNNISGATSSSYTTPPAMSTDNGTAFEVVVSNAEGSVTSNAAALTVNAAVAQPSYGTGFTASGLTLNGGALISGTRLRLTDGGGGEARSAFFNTEVNVQSFTNDFSFQLTNATADGFTFTIQGNSSTALGASGGALGYGSNSTNTIPGIGKSAAVGFQLYSTVLGNKAVSLTGSWTNGASPASTPGSDTTGSGVSLHSGDVMNVHMTYDGTTLTWTITDATVGKSFTKSVAINIPALAGNTAYVGFTGGTGGLTAIQDITTWTFTPGSTSPVPPSITTQPTNQTVTAGQTATFSVVASGATPLSYQWSKNTGSGYTPISGATSSSYTTPATTLADNGTTFEVTVTNMVSSVTSNPVTLTVTTSTATINFGTGFTSSGLTLNGSASISGTRLRLTDGGTGEARSAFFSTPVNVQSFTNDFSFQLTKPNADGFTFTIQGNSPSALGGGGGGLGYRTIANSVAVGFQLYSTVLGNIEVSLTGDWTNGASPSATPGTSTTGSGVNLRSGDLMNVHMTYDGTTLTWTITDSSTGKSFTQSVTINIPALTGNTAYVGFTGATGGLTATQDILTWTYTPAQ